MASKPPPTAPPKPPAKAASHAGASPARQATRSFGVSQQPMNSAQKIVIYGPGGVGKTKLASLIREVGVKPLFIDLEDGSDYLDVARINPPPETLEEVRLILHQWFDEYPAFNAVVIDSFTKLEELATRWAIENVPHEKGHKVDSLEGYGWGKGLTHVYETFLHVLGDLDRLSRSGRHVIAICHDCTASVPNPAGEDWIRYEPRLQSPASGKASIRHRVKEWCGHLLYVGFDAAVSRDGKATGSGTRTIYPQETPMWWAKSRLLREPMPYYDGDPSLWQQLLGGRD